MKLEITRTIQQKETISIEFPYYYKYDPLLDEVDWVTYGKIEENLHTSIQVRNDYRHNSPSFEFEIEDTPAARLSDWMTDEYASTEAEFLAAKEMLLKAAQGA